MRAFSGIQPSGVIHIGNYFGAIKNWVELQNKYECIFCVVNEHAITIPQNSKDLKKNTFDIAALYLAAGIDPKKSIIFIQSQVKEHTELCWILNTITKMPELERMTQFKDKSKMRKSDTNVGLFDYPVLMSADILLYKTNIVPVGQDQKQHVELARIIAKRFNKIFGETFKIPEALIKKESGKIMGLDDPTKKMSKSAASPFNYIALDDSPETIASKVKKAVTDSGKEIKNSPKKPAVSNLLNIYSLASKESVENIEKKFENKSYREFKEGLINALIDFLSPIQKKKKEILKDKSYIEKTLKNGQKKAKDIAKNTMSDIKEKTGLL